ncbi:DUF5366 family protein [Ferdinandcohnia quinoae]|uniref:YufK family protein n=1 Tax=Fredinandcohnia quinoae TaxID=2918902 RepID=A0AAW5DXW6_9BACI|nr:DUF5366 family protein [Fredinandcohnia sp. SECRCQ15]MCH1625501.1 YufK family protein [Fredinandcohnia sp. SECRCQ15]
MKNTYFTGYFPLISIMLFSISLAIYTEINALVLLKQVGIYRGMQEFFSVAGINLAIFFLFFLFYFMLFAALKLIADTLLELSLLFFSKDRKGDSLQRIRMGSTFYLVGAVASLFSINSLYGIIGIFFLVTVIYFIYFVYKIHATLSFTGLIGIVFFHILIWCTFFTTVIYLCIKLYNSMIASLPI